MQVSRRSLFPVLAAVGATTRAALAQQATPPPSIELRAQAVDLQLLATDGAKTKAWRFTEAGQPVDLLQATQGQEFRVRVLNDLDVELWLHWFGVRGPDGMMTINVPPHTEEGVECVFTPPDAGTFWLGPVIDVSRQRAMGLYAMLVVEAVGDQRFHDLPVTISDWKLADDGQIAQGFGAMDLAIGEGRLGNWFTVNSQYTPTFDAPAGKIVRLRLLNASNARTMSLQFKGPTPWIAALDGQPVPVAPMGNAAFPLAPGQRGDLLIDSSKEELTIALDLFGDLVELCHITRQGQVSVDLVTPSFSVDTNPVAGAPAIDQARTVAVVLEGGAKGGLAHAKINGVETDLTGLVKQGKAWAINGEVGLAGASIGSFATGETIILDIDNRTAFPQPLHIHGQGWWPLSVDGQIPENPQPVRDTVVVPAGVHQKMGFIAANPGLWILQSLVAERCDSGLLSTFRVG